MSRYDETVRLRACEYWQRMVELGTVDRARRIIEESRPKAERLVDVDTMEHTEEGYGGHLRDAGIQENALLEKNKSL